MILSCFCADKMPDRVVDAVQPSQLVLAVPDVSNAAASEGLSSEQTLKSNGTYGEFVVLVFIFIFAFFNFLCDFY